MMQSADIVLNQSGRDQATQLVAASAILLKAKMGAEP